MRICIGIEQGESIHMAEAVKRQLIFLITGEKIDHLDPDKVDIAAYLDDQGPITMTVSP